MFLYFIALMLVSLNERRLRRRMKEENTASLPLRPDRSHTKKPTWRTIRDTMEGIHLTRIEQSGRVIQQQVKGLDKLRQNILKLLKVPIEAYTHLNDRWWEFVP